MLIHFAPKSQSLFGARRAVRRLRPDSGGGAAGTAAAVAGAAVLACLTPLVGGAAAAAQQPAAASAAAAPRIGEVTIQHFSRMETERPRGGVLLFSITDAAITSARYDMSAPHMDISIKNGAVQTAAASGGVHLIARDPEAGQTMDVTCDTARYQRDTSGTGAGHIDMEGHVHTKTYTPQFEGAFEATYESGTIDFLPEGGMRVVANNGSAHGTPIEPAARPQAAHGTSSHRPATAH
jgi:hypothetical protein